MEIQVGTMVRWTNSRGTPSVGEVVQVKAPAPKNAGLFRNTLEGGWLRIEKNDGTFSMKHPSEVVVV